MEGRDEQGWLLSLMLLICTRELWRAAGGPNGTPLPVVKAAGWQRSAAVRRRRVLRPAQADHPASLAATPAARARRAGGGEAQCLLGGPTWVAGPRPPGRHRWSSS